MDTGTACAIRRWSTEDRLIALPPTGESVSEWADKNRILLARTSAEPGPWRTARVPYLKAFMDAFSSPDIEEIVICKSVQVGATEAIFNMMAWAIEQTPAPMLLVLPTIEIAAYVSRNRFTPMVEAIPSLVARKSDDVNEFNLLEMNFSGMVLSLAGANSAPSLATRPIRYLFMDEVDKYPAFAGREGEPIGIATGRTRTFWNRKIVKVSTPTTSTGNIWRAYLGCQARYELYVPCPYCGEYQTLTFWGDEEKGDYHIRWHEEDEPYEIEDVYTSTWYECQYCKGRITDKHKPSMLQSSQWRDQNGNTLENRQGRTVSFHINSLYSPWVTWGEIAVNFLNSRSSAEEYMNFVNLWLGLPVKDMVSEVIPEDVEHLVELYPQGEVPAEAITLLATVDVQKFYLQYVIRAWSGNLESWLIREGQVSDFDELREALIESSFPVKDSEKRMMIRMVLIDAGFRTEEVYDFIRMNNQRCKATKGSSHPLRAPYTASKIDRYPDGRAMPDGVTLWMFDTNFWKDALSRRIGLTSSTQDIISKWHIFKDVSKAYCYQLTAEEKTIQRHRKTRQTTETWQLKQGRKRNEAFDLEVMNLMAADMIGLKFFTVSNVQPKPVTTDIKKPAPKPAQSKWMRRR